MKSGRAPRHVEPLVVGADLWFGLGGRSLAGSRRIELLARIADTGSLTQAAKAVGLSYKGAWDAIEQMGNLAGEPLVERVAGGRGGGHTHLTERGRQLVHSYALIEPEHARFIERLNRNAGGLQRDHSLIDSSAIRTSARNQFAGTVSAVREGAVNDEIELAVIGGQTIVATITADSRRTLGLQPGTPAFALIKASSVLLLADAGNGRLSAANQFTGTVARIVDGAVNDEVVLELPGGGMLAAIVTSASRARLQLAVGQPATALFQASSVIVGVAG